MRLTEKCNEKYFTARNNMGVDYSAYTDMVSGGNVINKLGQLEDIEEELGIDLITLFKQSPLQLKALATLTKEELL